MADLDEFALAKLAREMAMNIRSAHAVFADYNIDETDYYEIEKIPFFQRCKEQYTLEWNATTSTAERVKVMSAAASEQILPYVSARATRPEEPLAAATKVFELVSRMAGIGEPKQGPNQSERFIITINLGADVDGKPIVEHYNKSIAPDANDMPQPTATYRNLPQDAATDSTPLTPEEIGLLSLMKLDE